MSKFKNQLDPVFNKVISPHLGWMERMVPWWCDLILLRNRTLDSACGSAADCDVDIEYRHGMITFYPTFLADSPDRQKEYIRHELFHFEIAWIIEWSSLIIKELRPDDKIMANEFRVRTEQVIQSLARKYNVSRKVPNC